MSKFRIYADKANEIAQTAFKEIVMAENKLREAEKQAKAYPQRNGAVTAEYAVMSAKANAALLEAREQLHKVQARMSDYARDIASIRQELSTALSDEYSADPAKIDTNALTLLQSGIMRGDEYARLFRDAKSAGNLTMSRIISRYASSAANEREKVYGKDDQQVMELRAIGCQCDDDADAVAAKLGEFGVLQEAFNRSVSNTAMIRSWDMLTADTIAEF